MPALRPPAAQVVLDRALPAILLSTCPCPCPCPCAVSSPENRKIRDRPYVDAGFDSAFHFVLRRALVDGIAHGGSVDRVASAVADGIARLGMDRALDLVLMMDNHDVPRFASEAGWGVPEDLIRSRQLLALDLLFTLPGIPQLYYGDELGLYGGGDPDDQAVKHGYESDARRRSCTHSSTEPRGVDVTTSSAAEKHLGGQRAPVVAARHRVAVGAGVEDGDLASTRAVGELVRRRSRRSSRTRARPRGRRASARAGDATTGTMRCVA